MEKTQRSKRPPLPDIPGVDTELIVEVSDVTRSKLLDAFRDAQKLYGDDAGDNHQDVFYGVTLGVSVFYSHLLADIPAHRLREDIFLLMKTAGEAGLKNGKERYKSDASTEDKS